MQLVYLSISLQVDIGFKLIFKEDDETDAIFEYLLWLLELFLKNAGII